MNDLQTCPACGKQYYRYAHGCPNCSSPNKDHGYQVWKSAVDDLKQKEEKKKKSIWNKIGIMIDLP